MKLALKVPPPVQALIFGIMMWFFDKRVPVGQFDFSLSLPVAISIAVAGFALSIVAMLEFRKVSTTVDPFHPEEASHLVVSGVFQYSRNPMYVGLSLVLIGWTIWLGSAGNFALLLLFVLYITTFQIKPEEKILRTLFGEPYEQYCAKVRRWI